MCPRRTCGPRSFQSLERPVSKSWSALICSSLLTHLLVFFSHCRISSCMLCSFCDIFCIFSCSGNRSFRLCSICSNALLPLFLVTFLEALFQVRELVDFFQLLRDLFFRSPSFLGLSASLSTSFLQSSSGVASSHVSSNCTVDFFNPHSSVSCFLHATHAILPLLPTGHNRRTTKPTSCARSSWTTLANAFRAIPSECQFCIFDTWLLSPTLAAEQKRPHHSFRPFKDDCLCHSSLRTSPNMHPLRFCF